MIHSTGKFLTLEGIDGAGKSTHLQWLADHLSDRGLSVVSTREPGGCVLAERLREIVLDYSMTLKTETLLMFAARSEHLTKTVQPALARGDWVVCDRFTDATFAYQGGGRGLGALKVAELERWVHNGFKPDLTWLFDVPLEVAAQRLNQASTPDRFEQENTKFFERTRAGYHARAIADKARFCILDGTQCIETLRTKMTHAIDRLVGHGA